MGDLWFPKERGRSPLSFKKASSGAALSYFDSNWAQIYVKKREKESNLAIQGWYLALNPRLLISYDRNKSGIGVFCIDFWPFLRRKQVILTWNSPNFPSKILWAVFGYFADNNLSQIFGYIYTLVAHRRYVCIWAYRRFDFRFGDHKEFFSSDHLAFNSSNVSSQY